MPRGAQGKYQEAGGEREGMREFSPSWAESQWLSCAGGSVTEILRYWMAKRAPLALQSPWDLPLPRQGGLQGLHQSSWLVEPRAGPVPTGLSVNWRNGP